MDNQPQPPLVSPNPQPTPIYDQPPTNGKKPILIIGLILLLLIIITGAIYAGIKIAEKKNQSQTSPTTKNLISPTKIQNVPSAVPTADLTVGWKTYTNTKYNFSLRLPLNMKLDKENEIQDTATDHTIFKSIDYKVDNTQCKSGCADPVVSGSLLMIRVQRNWKSGYDKEFFKKSPPSPSPGILFEDEKEINGITMLITERTRADLPDLGHSMYYADFVKNDNYLYRIEYSSTGKKGDLTTRNFFYQILSTFKFLSPSSSLQIPNDDAEAAGWKTYTSNELKFSIKYPEDLSVKEIMNGPVIGSIYFVKIGQTDSSKHEFYIEKNFKGGWMGKNIQEKSITTDGITGKLSLWINCDSNTDSEWYACNEKLSPDFYDSAFLHGEFIRGSESWHFFGPSWKKGERNEESEIRNMGKILSTFKFL